MSQQNAENSWKTLINEYTPILEKKFDELSFDKIFALFLNPESLNDFANNAPNLPSFGILNIFLIYVVYKRFNKSQLEIFKYFTENKYIFKEPSHDDLNELKNKLGITNNLTEDDLKVILFAIKQNMRIKDLLSFLSKLRTEELDAYMNSIDMRYQLTEIYYLPLEIVDQYIYEEYDISNNTNLNMLIPKILQFYELYELTKYSYSFIEIFIKTNNFNNVISCISNLCHNNKLNAFEKKILSAIMEIAMQTKINYCNNLAINDFIEKILNSDFLCIQLKYDMNNIVNSNYLNSIAESLKLETKKLQNVIKFIIELCDKKQTDEINEFESKILIFFINMTYHFAYTKTKTKKYVQYPYSLKKSFKTLFQRFPIYFEISNTKKQQNIENNDIIKFDYYENPFIQMLIESNNEVNNEVNNENKEKLYNYFVNPKLIENLLSNRLESDYQDDLAVLYSFMFSLNFNYNQKKYFMFYFHYLWSY